MVSTLQLITPIFYGPDALPHTQQIVSKDLSILSVNFIVTAKPSMFEIVIVFFCIQLYEINVINGDCRWREEQIKIRADHVASMLRSRPASIQMLAKKIEDEHGQLNTHSIYGSI